MAFAPVPVRTMSFVNIKLYLHSIDSNFSLGTVINRHFQENVQRWKYEFKNNNYQLNYKDTYQIYQLRNKKKAKQTILT